MRRMIVPRRQVESTSRYSIGVPWVARERRPSPWSAKLSLRLLWTALLTLALNAISYAEEPAPSSDAGTVPVVTTRVSTPTAVAKAPARRAALPAPIRLAPVPPADLRDVQAWVNYKQARHLSALPTEARLFYRRGLTAKLAGQDAVAMRCVRGASELDPTFVEPHLTIASWSLTREPSQALLQYAAVLDLLRQDFNLQLDLAANLLLLVGQAMFAGLLLAGVLIVWLRRDELMHLWQEQLGRFTSLKTARWWALSFLILPFVAGFGLALPTLVCLGLMWQGLRLRERALFVMLLLAVATMPLTLRIVERMALGLDATSAPFHGVTTLENESYSAARAASLRAAAAKHPDDAFVQFGLAWAARRGHDLPTAEKAYREVLRIWPDDSRVLNNLGNVLAVQGRTEEALTAYKKSGDIDPTNAAAWFNASQIYTQRFEYQLATDALSRASASQFEMVKAYQSQATDDGLLPLVDQWLDPKAFWRALSDAPLGADLRGSIPMNLRTHIETSGWKFSILTVILATFSIFVSNWLAKHLPLRQCSNCGRTVCRRCAKRRREHALCPACAQVEAQTETQDFSRLLLMQARNKHTRRSHWIRTALASVVPGYGLLAHRHVFTSVFLLGTTWVLAQLWFGYAPPFALEPRLTVPGEEIPIVLIAGVFVGVQLMSLLGYFHHNAKEREREVALATSQRGRVTQSTRRVSSMAA